MFDDTAILNYRKKKCWDLLLSELVTMAQDLSINGIHLGILIFYQILDNG